MAVFDPEDVDAVFRSTIPGREQVQVGRWRPVGQQRQQRQQRRRDGDDGSRLGRLGESPSLSNVKDWEEVWNGNGYDHSERMVLPRELGRLL
jgi:hypothetical protein